MTLQFDLETAFPTNLGKSVISTVSSGIKLADDLATKIPLLGTPVGRDLRGHIRRSGVMYALRQATLNGSLPFSAEFEVQTRGHWHWLVMRKDRFVMHLVRTPSASEFPEDVPTRRDMRLKCQLDLLDAINPPTVEESPEVYGWLFYGMSANGGLSHIGWGVPYTDTDRYAARVDLSASLTDNKIQEEIEAATPPSIVLGFKDYVLNHIEDSDSKPDSL